jgi:ectoine hydroxylase
MTIRDASCLQYALTEAECVEFNKTGLLMIENALSPEQVAALTGATDQIYAQKVAEGQDPHKALFYPNFIPDNPLFADLVDYEKILPKVWGILGWNIYLYHGHLIVTPPSGQAQDNKTFGWHQDSGRVNQEMESHPRPRLSLKVAYFLSDTSQPGRGNFWVVPGSHLWDTMERPPTASVNQRVPSLCWRSRAQPSSLTGACGTRPAPIGPTSRARCSSMVMAIAGSARRMT